MRTPRMIPAPAPAMFVRSRWGHGGDTCCGRGCVGGADAGDAGGGSVGHANVAGGTGDVRALMHRHVRLRACCRGGGSASAGARLGSTTSGVSVRKGGLRCCSGYQGEAPGFGLRTSGVRAWEGRDEAHHASNLDSALIFNLLLRARARRSVTSAAASPWIQVWCGGLRGQGSLSCTLRRSRCGVRIRCRASASRRPPAFSARVPEWNHGGRPREREVVHQPRIPSAFPITLEKEMY
ncbi:hypothetical protein B0H11DRAFT_2095101 [Mycena galericulata]|nr:hypothetical protein B0H11DRAFT_2095101 [Mycena galericulata]